jgi:hypothetical protein
MFSYGSLQILQNCVAYKLRLACEKCSGAGLVRVGLTLLQLESKVEVESLQLILISVQAVILAMLLRIRIGSPLLFVLLYLY